MNLFPYILIRVSGGSFERMQALEFNETVRTAEKIYHLEEKLADIKQTISRGFYQLIPRIEDREIQNLLLNCRRDIFNEREIPLTAREAFNSHLPGELKKAVRDYLETRESIRELKIQVEAVYLREAAETRKNFRTLAADPVLQKGLLLSSQSLLKRIPGYLGKESPTNKKDFQTQRGLMKYISRMYCKTSPFSTFTNLALGKPEPAAGPGTPFLQTPGGENTGIVHHIRLNNFLYEHLQTLLCKNPLINRHFLVRPNPTLEKGADDYLYLTNSRNIEAFQRISINPVLEVFLDLTAGKREGIKIKDLIAAIVRGEYIEAAPEEIDAYILQLLEYGFFEYNIGVSGIDPDWDIKLREVLDAMETPGSPVPFTRELSDTLGKIRTLARGYGQAPCRQREKILEDSFQQYKDICMKLHEAAGLSREREKQEEETVIDDETFKHTANTGFHFTPEQMFYEDTTVNITPGLDEKRLTEFIYSLHGMLRQIRPFRWHRPERAQMNHFFLEKYGKNTPVDLMTFYEDYYREIKKPEAEWLKNKENKNGKNKYPEQENPFLKIPEVIKIEQEKKAWLDCFTAGLKKRLIPGDDEVSICPGDLRRPNREYPGEKTGKTRGTGCSYGAFIQFYIEKQPGGGEKLKGVINSLFPGYGKLFSRFLHIFDQTVTRDIRQWNETAAGDELLAEDCDASYFNANIHPPLLPYEIRIPGGHNSLPPKNQLPITQLQVRWNEKENALQLIDRHTQKQVYVFDLGFQGHSGRSRLFQLLEKFTLAEYPFILPLIRSTNEIAGKSSEKEKKKNSAGIIHVNPRIVYDHSIVLQRKTWYIPRERLPGKEPGETQWAYFLRIDKWRRHLQIPEEVYVYVTDRTHIKAPGPGKSGQGPGRDDYKPQYISFANPYLIDLLEKMIKRVPRGLKVVEMLPNSRQLLQFRGKRHVTEFTVQWYDRYP
jgi:hypothetical protein